MVTTISQLHCYRCGHDWFPKREQLPTVCPRCKSYVWMNPKSGPRARMSRPDSESDKPASGNSEGDAAGSRMDQPTSNPATYPSQPGAGETANAAPAGRGS